MWKLNNSVLCCVLLLVCACAQAQQEGASRAVRISQGPLRGFKAPGEDYFVFYNIPYATAPTGTDRFKDPLPAPVWLTERQAVDQNVTCPQVDYKGLGLVTKTNMQENCLIADVYIPDTDETNLPVVVYVHGGAYLMGFGKMGVPKLLLNTKKFIAVTFNYRVGIHGFLCLGTHDVPGNAGMKDQVALLRWVKQNIAQFGGNPNDVTIDGYSAGSSAVDLLILSETATGLFHKVIAESGANMSPWSIQQDPIENARSFAEEFLNFEGGDILALEKFYKTLSYDELDKHITMERQHFYFSPCVERDLGRERFLKKSPYEILKEGKYIKVPMLYGFANMEGLFRLDYFEDWKDKMNSNFADFLPADLKFKDEQERQNVAASVKEFYFGKEPVSDDTIVGYVNYFTDVMFGISMVWSVKLQVEAGNNNVYLYLYSFGDEALSKASGFTDPRLVGANHVAQTFILLDFGPMEPLSDDSTGVSEDYKKVQSTTEEIWTNFISTGKPVPEGSSLLAWPTAGASGAPHMVIDRQLALGGPLLGERAQFWLRLYEDYYSVPSPPAHVPTTQHAEL